MAVSSSDGSAADRIFGALGRGAEVTQVGLRGLEETLPVPDQRLRSLVELQEAATEVSRAGRARARK